MTEDHVRVEDADGVRTILMNRSAKKNAITASMYGAMADAFLQADADDATRAILFSGAAGVFTAGNDLRDFLEDPPRSADAPVRRFLEAVAFCGKPIVAAVPGLAVGVGTTILLHCDLVYAAPGARFMTPFANLGLVPEAGSSMILPAMLGQARAARLLMLGEGIDARTAHDWGLVSEVVDPPDLERRSREAALALAAKPARAVAATKRLMRPDRATLQAAMDREFEVFAAMLDSEEARAAFAAFLAK